MTTYNYQCPCGAERHFKDAGIRVKRYCYECDEMVVFERLGRIEADPTNYTSPEKLLAKLQGD